MESLKELWERIKDAVAVSAMILTGEYDITTFEEEEEQK